MQYSLGIDIGKKGALVILQKNKDLISIRSKIAMPLFKDGSLNMNAIMDFIDDYIDLGGTKVCMEKIVPIFRVSKTSYGVLKYQEGVITALCACKSLDLVQVLSREWQEYSFRGIQEIKKKNDASKRDTKAMALKAVQQQFPKENLVFGARALVPHDGLVDAILIANYNLLILSKDN